MPPFSVLFLTIIIISGLVSLGHGDSIAIYPHETETRQVISLDGVWNFRLQPEHDQHLDGFRDKWAERSLELIEDHYNERMPVPASFNDITQRREVRDFVGWAWYDRAFFVPSSWAPTHGAILLRLGSVQYIGTVYVNGHFAVNHTGGHLPFEADVTTLVKIGESNRITVAVNNALSPHSIPQGNVKVFPDGLHPGKNYTETHPNQDFFNYAGIHRSVLLSFVPKVRITDLTVTTTISTPETTGLVKYKIESNSAAGVSYELELLDKTGKSVIKTTSTSGTGTLTVPNANLWYPFATPGKKAGYLYTLRIKLLHNSVVSDIVYQKVGIRKVALVNGAFEVNNQKVYLRGFGKHEDQNIRGRSLDPAMIAKDFNLMKWSGANSFRTSHYPYSEQIMDEADAQGFLVIDEVPAVGLYLFDDKNLEQHSKAVTEMITRDRNRPSVIMWSITNEPDLSQSKPELAASYFNKVAELARALDPDRRPITGANVNRIPATWDVQMINQYAGWYQHCGYPQSIPALSDFLGKLHRTGAVGGTQVPLMFSEYGADTVEGVHADPGFVFSEDYQVELLAEYHKLFDGLRAAGALLGEHVWNFADFMTHQDTNRVLGNRKGIFTRERAPKTGARVLRCRYWKLAGDAQNPHRQGLSLCPEVVY